MRTFLGVTFALFIASGLLFLNTVQISSSNETGKHLKVSFGGAPETLDPAQVNGMLEARLLLCLYEGLTRLNPKTLEPQPGVAKRWTFNDDKTRWTFYFRDGENAARWSNGKKVKPEHFEFAWKRVLSTRPPSPYDQQLYRYIKNAGKYYFSDTLSDISSDTLHIDLSQQNKSEIKNLLDKFNQLKKYGTQSHLEKLSLFSKQFSRILTDEHRGQINSDLLEKVTAAKEKISTTRTDLKNRTPVSWDDVGIETHTNKLTVTLRNPTPHFAKLTAFMTYYPVYPPLIKRFPSAIEPENGPLAGDETKWTKPRNLVTNGPFQLSEWVFSDRITMKENPHYHDKERPYVDTLSFYAIEDSMTSLNMFLHGDLDLTVKVPNRLKRKLQKKNVYHEWVRFNTECLRFNVAREPFDDPRVRKAFAMAINRSKLTENITRGEEKPTTRWVPNSEKWYEPPEGIGFNPERARELLAEAGYPNGDGIDNVGMLLSESQSRHNIFVGVQKMLQKHLGVQLKARKKEWSVYLSEMQDRNYDICLGGWIGDYYDPMTFLDMFITNGKNNRTNWGSEEYDQIIEQASQTGDPKRRFELLRRAEQILIQKELPFTPLYNPTNTALWDPDRLAGIHKNSLGIMDMKYIQKKSE